MDNLCPFFQKGSCKFGDNCRNKHQIANGASFTRNNNNINKTFQNNNNTNTMNIGGNSEKIINKNKGICTYFLQNKCNSGVNCK